MGIHLGNNLFFFAGGDGFPGPAGSDGNGETAHADLRAGMIVRSAPSGVCWLKTSDTA